MSLTGEVHKIRQDIERWARSYGLDFFKTIFELVDVNQLSEIAAYGGFPTRYPHWRFGMDFDQIAKGHDYGLHKIYELVINNDPCYAYLMRNNSLVDQKIVIAHVFAHGDFFKNNAWFKQTHRKMMDKMGNHATKVKYYCEKYGCEEIENFIDICLSIENLCDIYHPYSPSEVLKKSKDVVGFLLYHAPLEDWQHEVIKIIYEESTYFIPQAQTKIMNEGWASYWHSKILTEKALKDTEVIDFADHHAGTLAVRPGQINPYKLGIELFRDIERRWSRDKIFQVRKLYNDITFIDEYLTEEFCEKQKLFVYAYNKRNGTYEIVDRDYKKIKEKLLFSLTNLGHPLIYVSDGNYLGNGSLLLMHDHQEIDQKIPETKATLERIFELWKKNVCLETRVNGERRLLIYTGKEHQEKSL